MVTVNNKTANNTGTAAFELLGLSTDTKPTGKFSGYKVGENSVFLELDTATLYYFTGGEWVKFGESGGSGDTYETVAEIEVGHMQSGGEEMPGVYIYSDSEAVAPALNENETYYLNAADNESNSVVIDLDAITLRFNASTGEGLPTPLDTDKKMYVIQWAGNGLTFVSDTADISNTTVKILKKVSA